MTDFLRCYLGSLSIARIANFLTLLLNGVKERKIGSSGALSAVLAAFDLGGKRVPAMGHDILFQLKDTLLVILPPLNQVRGGKSSAGIRCQSQHRLFFESEMCDQYVLSGL